MSCMAPRRTVLKSLYYIYLEQEPGFTVVFRLSVATPNWYILLA